MLDISAALKASLTPDLEGDNERALVELLGDLGFVYAPRSATNIRLLAEQLPLDTVTAIVLCALESPMPDMALNNLERISTIVPKEQLLLTCNKSARLCQLLALLGSSPFLTNIICRDPEAFTILFFSDGIEIARNEAAMLAALRSEIPPVISYQELFSALRRFKYREMLRIAARDLSGISPLEEVTAELSSLAAASLQLACEITRSCLIAEHGAPLLTESGDEAELTILGMGKFGGRELNFSSDIDLIYFYTSDQGETTGIPDNSGVAKGKISLHSFFVKQAEMITKIISQVTDEGFVFRVDLGLRPEGKGGDVSLSVRSGEVYYELWGQSWERSAMLKARPVAGSIPLGEAFLKSIEPFIYRKYLDYTLIEDMMSMKKKIDASLVRELEGEYNIKLGRGGIREIEFFIQALQLVYAGKNPNLRERNSLKSLNILEEAGIISTDDRLLLTDAYRFLRTVEHRIQVVQERQTHNLPKKDDEFLALARRNGFLTLDGAEQFRQELERHRGNVSSVYGNLFLSRDEKIKEEVPAEIYHFFDRNADPDMLKDMLAERRFRNVDVAYDNLILLRDGRPRVNLTERANRLLGKIAPLLLKEIFASPDPDMAMSNLERFLSAVGTRSTFYALLAENREVLKLIISLFGMSEFLSKIFIGHPELLDSMVSKTLASSFKDREQMEDELKLMLSQAADFEERLDMLRRYRHEEFLRIGMNDIYGKLGQTEIASQLTYLADACLKSAVQIAKDELTRFGKPLYRDPSGVDHEADFAVIGMGKMGGLELNYHSDLDIIYIYDHQGYTDGVKQISNHEYFAKLGQKIIMILTTQTREGYVYKLDTRLRPSGNAGPLVTSLESFKTYHTNEAQVWERQSLTKSRVVLG
ncbi:MAG: bifunctional [glutamate--ammonia ligase]-adenylyl-L-tyrosine phosphorylase/[glutamate--ammonia-ligase] adenylyltransferase, partial [Geobacteraceae bacterium]|nr:bifunctional [glutamate--ammonia ligase]-adenylyl-L-tyrosine phosphorylase/[glutamate--ammonia-ligase] adenylyltransferase [Geobacteraceae bacterium]